MTCPVREPSPSFRDHSVTMELEFEIGTGSDLQ
jgi:hypothetical protein